MRERMGHQVWMVELHASETSSCESVQNHWQQPEWPTTRRILMAQRLNDSPDVIPLQISGTIDTNLLRLTTNEMMSWGLANLWQQGKESGYY